MKKNNDKSKFVFFKPEISRSIRHNISDKRSVDNNDKRNTRPFDKYLLSAIILLILFGLIALFSSSLFSAQSNKGDAYFYVKRQLSVLLIGLPLLFIFLRIDYRIFKKLATIFLFLSIFLLILVFIPGVRGNFGTSYSWIVIFGQSIQVAELAKLCLIFYLASWVEIRKDDLKKFSTGLLPFLSVVLLIGILLIAQPDIGTFILVFVIALSIYFVAGGNVNHLIILFLILIAVAIYMFPKISSPDSSGVVKSYQINRIKCVQDPSFDKDICYQINQSLIAVGSGGLWGRGLGNSLQKFNYLPEVWSDSIFPIIAEEIGFIGSILLILVYMFILYKGLLIARRAPDMYGRSLAVGISVWIFFQAFLNIGGMLNLIPMTGVPLPFVSHGGSSIIVLLLSCGILLNISRHGILPQKKYEK